MVFYRKAPCQEVFYGIVKDLCRQFCDFFNVFTTLSVGLL